MNFKYILEGSCFQMSKYIYKNTLKQLEISLSDSSFKEFIPLTIHINFTKPFLNMSSFAFKYYVCAVDTY